MRVTVCEIDDENPDMDLALDRLREHVRGLASELVVLPELPFSPWPFHERTPSDPTWDRMMASHAAYITKLDALGARWVLGTRPTRDGNQRRNQGFLWTRGEGVRALRQKRYLPDEPGFWEASWYARSADAQQVTDLGDLRLGLAICTELWFFEGARSLGKGGAHLIAHPRATEKATVETWILAGRSAAIVSGAYVLSANKVNPEGRAADLGGGSFVVDPHGVVLATTTRDEPFATVDIDLSVAEKAKSEYPQYVLD